MFLGHSVSLSVSLKTSLRQPAQSLKAAPQHPCTSSSCLTSITVNYLSPRHWHLLSSEVSLDWFCKRLLRVWTGFGCDPLWVSGIWPESQQQQQLAYQLIWHISVQLLYPPFFLTLLSVWALHSGGKFELWRLQQGEGLVSGGREGKKEGIKGRNGMRRVRATNPVHHRHYKWSDSSGLTVRGCLLLLGNSRSGRATGS